MQDLEGAQHLLGGRGGPTGTADAAGFGATTSAMPMPGILPSAMAALAGRWSATSPVPCMLLSTMKFQSTIDRAQQGPRKSEVDPPQVGWTAAGWTSLCDVKY